MLASLSCAPTPLEEGMTKNTAILDFFVFVIIETLLIPLTVELGGNFIFIL